MNSYDLVEKINFEVNSTITYKTDLDNYETPEFWTLPTKCGDCEEMIVPYDGYYQYCISTKDGLIY